MKKINVKSVLTTCMVILIATTGAFASSESMKAIMENIKAEKAATNQSLIKINHQQESVKALTTQCKHERTAVSHERVKAAKAELKASKAQLKKDECDLMKAHKAHIKEHTREVRVQVLELTKAQMTVDRDFAKRSHAVLPAAEILMDERAELRNRMTALERARLGRDKDRFVLSKERNDRKGESSLELSMAHGDVSPQNVAVK